MDIQYPNIRRNAMMGKPDGLDRLMQAVIALVALFAVANGVFMLADPLVWYGTLETVQTTGPANRHFIGDIGLAAHGAFHVYEVTTGICGPDVFWQDAPGVLGPPLLVLLAVGVQVARQRISPVPLPKHLFLSIMRKVAGKAEPYLDDLDRAAGFATEKFQHAMLLSGHRYHAPAPLLHMARLGSTRVEDCGPCVEIVRQFALADGLDPDRIQNALMGRPDCDEDALAYDFGMAVSSGDVAAAAELGDRIEALYGRKVRTELALGAASGRLFPAIKRGLGLASACTIPRAG
jgi:alkylhydroperoxidase family enzyme